MMWIFNPPPSFTLEDVWIAVIVLVIISAIEAGILLGLIIRAGSFKELVRLTTSKNKPCNDTNNKRG